MTTAEVLPVYNKVANPLTSQSVRGWSTLCNKPWPLWVVGAGFWREKALKEETD